jgi:dethiobiotin synthetase
MSGVFVTGTDTDCGKTAICLGLMAAWQAQGSRVLGMKPVASGCVPGTDGLRHADALRLLEQGSSAAPYGLVNPYALEPAIAPHIAAGLVGVDIGLERITIAYRALAAEADRVVVEGVGGWRVPLNTNLFVGDIPKALGLPVLLVVGLRLGCLNHALLTAEAIRGHGCILAGWVGNTIDPAMQALDANVATLAALMRAPCIGIVPRLAQLEAADLAGFLHPQLLALPGEAHAYARG